LDHDKKSEVEADLNSMDSQIRSPKPKVNILKEIGSNILDIVKPFASEAVKQAGMSALGQNNLRLVYTNYKAAPKHSF
jgi:hypothetical protein